MFGHVVAEKETLSEAELARYSAVYCGLCRTLGQDFGQTARLGLTYDMTFLAVLLSSLYEPAETESAARCMVHPMKQHTGVQSEITHYAASLTVALTYYKALDDWQDDRSLRGKFMAGRMDPRYRQVRADFPRQCTAVEDGMARIAEVERAPGSPEPALQAFGSMLGELFVWQEDIWARSLRRFGMQLGQLIYLLDSAVDYEKDLRSGNWNPLVLLGRQPEDMKETLVVLAGQAAEIFECLPLEQDLSLMRNILYAGIWQRYNAAMEKKKKKEEGKQHG